ncbi:TetR/AcrR family transcriptional regulator [Amycolatopsis sp. NPDC047767]|jgi:AcrR family transcriptional regulator|uniref:TetR/AcrR family transcriptional regulator n=1 Tax=Amycolatopsis sp. NPDC047767 TaxID=3156765 RepID=UPI003456D604
MVRAREAVAPASASVSVEVEPGADWRHYDELELTPLLAAALDAFYEHGFHGTSVRDIVRRVGQTVPSLYYHHDSKEGAFAALLDLGTGEAVSRVNAAAADAAGPREQLVNVVEAVVLHMTHRTRLAALDLELRHLSPDSRKRYAARRKEIETVLTGIIEDGAREGVFTVAHPEETVRAVLGMCQSIARWYQPGGPLKPEELAGRYVDLALRTVGARPVKRKR